MGEVNHSLLSGTCGAAFFQGEGLARRGHLKVHQLAEVNEGAVLLATRRGEIL